MGRVRKVAVLAAAVPAARWAWQRYGDDVRTMNKGKLQTAVHKARSKVG
ncbi:MAG: hypothetical protein ACRDYU_13640 [Actinomycetes bacterium]